MDHRRYWFKAIKEQLVVMVLGGNNGILVYLDITGFLGFTRLLDYAGFLGSFGLLGSNDFNWFTHEPHVEDDFLEISSSSSLTPRTTCWVKVILRSRSFQGQGHFEVTVISRSRLCQGHFEVTVISSSRSFQGQGHFKVPDPKCHLLYMIFLDLLPPSLIIIIIPYPMNHLLTMRLRQW